MKRDFNDLTPREMSMASALIIPSLLSVWLGLCLAAAGFVDDGLAVAELGLICGLGLSVYVRRRT
jgi:hypothetical protein